MGQPLSIARRLFLVCECKVTIIFLYLQISERNSLRFISNSLIFQLKRLFKGLKETAPDGLTKDCIKLNPTKKKKLCQNHFDTALLNNYTKLSQVSLERFAVYACLKTADRFFLNLTYTLTSKTKLLAYFF